MLNNFANECDLHALLSAVVDVCVGPPVPAPIRIEGSKLAYFNVRVHNYDVVCLSVSVESSIFGVFISNQTLILEASVEAHMQFARVAVLTRCGDIDVPGVIDTVVATVEEEGCLIKLEKIGVNCARTNLTDFSVVEHVEGMTCTVVVAVTDVGT